MKVDFGNIVAWRILFIVVLLVVAVVLGIGSNILLSRSETELAESQFDSIAERALTFAQGITLRKRGGAATMATIVEQNAPDAENWPFITVSGYEEMAIDLIETSDSRELGLAPLVTPAQLSDFETFAYDYFESKFDNETGLSSFGKGVFGVNPALDNSDKRYHETDGSTYYGSPNKIFAPFIQMSSGRHPVLMLNLHFQHTRGNAIDSLMACAAERANTSDLSRECGVITDILTLEGETTPPGPGAVIFQPIYPANNRTTLTGISAASIVWQETLVGAFSDQVSGVDVVLTSMMSQYTYRITDGVALLIGAGDLHDPDYDRYGLSGALTPDGLFGGTSTTYTLAVYPSNKFFDVYQTSNPLIATVGSVLIIAFTSLLFFLYDFFVRKEASQRIEVLEAKRRFVRFISHEVRTPLNTVCMGLGLLEEELTMSFSSAGSVKRSRASTPSVSRPAPNMGDDGDDFPSAKNHIPTNLQIDTTTPMAQDTSMVANPKVVAKRLISLTREILSNSQSAVDVLNDLLNYDKIEMGKLSLELSIVPIWALIENTVTEFALQAKKAKVEYELDMTSLLADEAFSMELGDEGHVADRIKASARELKIIGDNVRLTQVLRNLISNGLKFTPEGGKLCVTAVWEESASMSKHGASSSGGDDNSDLAEFTLNSGEKVAYRTKGVLKLLVKDSGAGMSREQVAKLFNEGVQFNVNQLQAGQGSGLGLYIAKDIVEQHAGSLLVSSEGLGYGTTFTVSIPLYHVPPYRLPPSADERSYRSVSLRGSPNRNSPISSRYRQQQQQQQQQQQENEVLEEEEEDSVAPRHGKDKLHLLVVDDAASNRKMLTRLLTNKQHTCEEAKHGQEAIDKYVASQENGKPFDSILMDFEMPVMNGPDAAKVIRGLGCDCFIVGITGNVLSEDIALFKSCGANEVLPKPLQLPNLEALWRLYGVLLSDTRAPVSKELTTSSKPNAAPPRRLRDSTSSAEEKGDVVSASEGGGGTTAGRSAVHPLVDHGHGGSQQQQQQQGPGQVRLPPLRPTTTSTSSTSSTGAAEMV